MSGKLKNMNYTIVTSLGEGEREKFLEKLITVGAEKNGKRILAGDFTRACIRKFNEDPKSMVALLEL